MNKIIAIAALMALALPQVVHAEGDESLYRTRVVVTGERDETRYPGIAECFRDALVKASGDVRLLQDPRLEELASRARSFVWSYTYHDRLFGKPLKDEQGTRDRPFDLTVQFDKDMMDEALAGLGKKPWAAPRPKLAVFLAVKSAGNAYVLSADADLGSLQREAFGDASEKYGIEIVFPTTAQLAGMALDFQTVLEAKPDDLAGRAKEIGADLALVGNLIWSRADLGWVATWQIDPASQPMTWQIRGVNFDAAFRDALSGAALILSGNGAPG